MAKIDVTAIPVKPEEAIAFFRAKGFRLEESWGWRDLEAQQHAHTYTVAKSAGFDILTDLYQATREVIENGKSVDAAVKDLIPILTKKGWWGEVEGVNPVTGEKEKFKVGPRRIRNMLNTNLRTSYMTGKWQRFMRLKEVRPWLRYVAVLDNRVRHQHRSWHGVILKWDDPWWVQHFPPNDFGCRCDVQQLSDRDLERFNFEVTPRAPTSLPRRFFNRKTGATEDVPQGIRPGFQHNVGLLAQAAHSGRLLMERLVDMPAAMAAQAFQQARAIVLSGVSYEFQGWLRDVIGTGLLTGSLRVLAALPPQAVAALAATGGPAAPAALRLTDEVALGLSQLHPVDQLPLLVANARALLRVAEGEGQLLLVLAPRADGALTCLRMGADGQVLAMEGYTLSELSRMELVWGVL